MNRRHIVLFYVLLRSREKNTGNIAIHGNALTENEIRLKSAEG
jgi:hypothetical protein